MLRTSWGSTEPQAPAPTENPLWAVHVHVHVNVHVHVHCCMCICACACACACASVYVHMCLCLCIGVCTYVPVLCLFVYFRRQCNLYFASCSMVKSYLSVPRSNRILTSHFLNVLIREPHPTPPEPRCHLMVSGYLEMPLSGIRISPTPHPKNRKKPKTRAEQSRDWYGQNPLNFHGVPFGDKSEARSWS